MPMTIVPCPQCKASLQIPSGAPAGAKSRCPRCSAVVVLPAVAPAEVSPLPPLPERKPVGLGLIVAVGGIVCGVLAVVAVAAILVVVCLQGDGEDGSNAKDAVAANDGQVDADPETPIKRPAKKTPTRPQPLIALSRENQEKADLLTRRGVNYLKNTQTAAGPDAGSWPGGFGTGYTALAGLTLLECDVAPSDPVVQRAAANVRQRLSQENGDKEVYHVAVALLFLTRLDERGPDDRKLIRSLALRLAANQLASGGWVYSCPALSPDEEQTVLTTLKALSAGAAQEPRGAGLRLPFGVSHKPPPKNTREFYRAGDNSCTQFALLALWNARRYDLPLDPVLQRVAEHFRQSQNTNGTWNYSNIGPNPSLNPTMTCAGLLGLAVGYGLDQDAKAGSKLAQDEAIHKALRVVAGAIQTGKQQRPEMYFLWSIERVAVLYRLAKIEGKDWYPWGLEQLVEHQQADGSWNTHAGPVPSQLTDTCFALLFLQRANLAKDLTDKLQELMALLGPAGKKE